MVVVGEGFLQQNILREVRGGERVAENLPKSVPMQR